MTTDELLSIPYDGSMPVTHTSAFIQGLSSQGGAPQPGLPPRSLSMCAVPEGNRQGAPPPGRRRRAAASRLRAELPGRERRPGWRSWTRRRIPSTQTHRPSSRCSSGCRLWRRSSSSGSGSGSQRPPGLRRRRSPSSRTFGSSLGRSPDGLSLQRALHLLTNLKVLVEEPSKTEQEEEKQEPTSCPGATSRCLGPSCLLVALRPLRVLLAPSHSQGFYTGFSPLGTSSWFWGPAGPLITPAVNKHPQSSVHLLLPRILASCPVLAANLWFRSPGHPDTPEGDALQGAPASGPTTPPDDKQQSSSSAFKDGTKRDGQGDQNVLLGRPQSAPEARGRRRRLRPLGRQKEALQGEQAVELRRRELHHQRHDGRASLRGLSFCGRDASGRRQGLLRRDLLLVCVGLPGGRQLRRSSSQPQQQDQSRLKSVHFLELPAAGPHPPGRRRPCSCCLFIAVPRLRSSREDCEDQQRHGRVSLGLPNPVFQAHRGDRGGHQRSSRGGGPDGRRLPISRQRDGRHKHPPLRGRQPGQARPSPAPPGRSRSPDANHRIRHSSIPQQPQTGVPRLPVQAHPVGPDQRLEEEVVRAHARLLPVLLPTPAGRRQAAAPAGGQAGGGRGPGRRLPGEALRLQVLPPGRLPSLLLLRQLQAGDEEVTGTLVSARRQSPQHLFHCFTSSRWLEAMEKAIRPVTQNHVWEDVTRHNCSLPPLAVKHPERLGLLHKLDTSRDAWVQHYCILKDGCLSFYSGIRATHAQGGIYLQGYTVREQPCGSKKSSIELKPPSDEFKTFYFCAENAAENKRWILALRASVKKWLPLRQALQDFMSQPPEETRM
ncbi:unnamed protein product [Tetraodon nigroviridis]|uniref:Chromosome undetermined SCAF8103, whole genome shotgun sequence n=1 Tax=Tetraodon nigroviridis TaxID=99883 RepID=Q4T7G0_TETNG|nr:unnamed protein product [Tetraodon nigroviridis]